MSRLCRYSHLLPGYHDKDISGRSYADQLAYEYGITISDLGAARWLDKSYPVAVIQTREYRSPEACPPPPHVCVALQLPRTRDLRYAP